MQKKHRRIVIVLAGVVVVAGLGAVRLWSDPPLGFYRHWSMRPHALPAKFIRPAFRYATGHDLPVVTREAQAIWSGDREPSIFVRFRTDPNGLAYIEETFGGAKAQSEAFTAEEIDILTGSGGDFYPMPRLWQQKVGLSLYGPRALGAGRHITFGERHGGGWSIYIDEEHGFVYVLAHPYS